MKRIRQVNGYTIMQAACPRDEAWYGCSLHHYNIYISQDIRDYGLSNSYPEYQDIDTLVEALNICCASKYAIACALADELSGSTAQDMDLVLEIERRLEAGEAVNTIREELGNSYLDEDFTCGYGSVEQFLQETALNAGEDEDLLDGDLEDQFDRLMDCTSEQETDDCQTYRDWMKAHFPDKCGTEFCGGCAGCPGDRIPGGPSMGSAPCDALPSCRLCWDQPLPAALRSRRSHASYAVLRDPDDGEYATIAPPMLSEGIRNRHEANLALLSTVAKHYAFSDCGGWSVEEIVIDGEPVEYAGWRPGMEFVFTNTRTGEIVFDVCYPEWDH